MIKLKGSLSVGTLIVVALAINIILAALGTFCIRLAKANYIHRMIPQDKKKTDNSKE